MIFTGDITFFGPSDLYSNKKRDFDELVNYDCRYLMAGVDVCMVDSGIDMSHPDLSNLNLAEWSDFIEALNPYDDHGHGTMMAGILLQMVN